jgi:hypothetical protein
VQLRGPHQSKDLEGAPVLLRLPDEVGSVGVASERGVLEAVEVDGHAHVLEPHVSLPDGLILDADHLVHVQHGQIPVLGERRLVGSRQD